MVYFIRENHISSDVQNIIHPHIQINSYKTHIQIYIYKKVQTNYQAKWNTRYPRLESQELSFCRIERYFKYEIIILLVQYNVFTIM